MSDAPSRLSNALVSARTVARLLVKNGLLFNLRPDGVREVARLARAGISGPAAAIHLHAANRPDRIALKGGGRAYTYATLGDRADRLAAGLKASGLGPRDPILLMMRNRTEMSELQLAIALLGGSAVNVSWRSTPAELEYLALHSDSKAIFVEADLSPVVDQVRPKLSVEPNRYFVVGGTRDGFVPYDAAFATTRERMDGGRHGAVVVYTSGTTGKPKGAVRRFPRAAIRALMRFVAETPLRTDDRHLVVCPMYHSTAYAFAGITTTMGGTVVIPDGFDPEGFLRTVEAERITTSAVVPTMLHRIMALPASVRRRYDTSSLRCIFSGGAPLSGELARAFIHDFGPILWNFYGATETGINTVATPEELLACPNTIGHIVPGNEIRFLDDKGNEVPRGETGELYVRNEMLMAGYHRDEDATRSSMRDGYFSVGDLGHIDSATGLLLLDGRKRDMVISGGVNVYPAEVEAALSSCPLVDECAVIGVPDPEWGERVRAFVVRKPGTDPTPAEILAHCKGILAGPKMPRDIVFLDELPKNPTGKVLKRELRLLGTLAGGS
ncbi:MAG: AMP-binding protein [Deltaproteobacteria bacterium]|nr:AMP-binding protein [Deltaproteobacteria bacterium]